MGVRTLVNMKQQYAIFTIFEINAPSLTDEKCHIFETKD
jgi:hypothetical protein